MNARGDTAALSERFRDHLEESGCLNGAERAVIAVSGGVDSMTLLHLLRFGGGAPAPALHAAHLDHRMRADSADDAAWLGEVCAGWGVTYHLRAAPAPVRTEAEGRELRYGFFAELAEVLGPGTVILTGHTADDQAETVLFRIARGSGPRGLGGIDPGRPPGPVRPLLPFRRVEVEAYAASQAVPYRDDPTNRDPRWTRNRLRHEVLPALEAAVPGAAAALVSLAGTSRLESAALDLVLDERIAATAAVGSASGSPRVLSFDREALAVLPDPLLTVLLRRVAARLGGSPGRGATAALLRFVREAPSGRRITPAAGVDVEHHLGVLHFRGAAAGGAQAPTAPGPGAAGSSASAPSFVGPVPRVHIDPPDGAGAFAYGACTVTVSWQSVGRVPPGAPFVAHFAPEDVRFPLAVRPWVPGDRMTLPYGKKKVKKILLEARLPADRREGWPVVADAGGAIVWVPGAAPPCHDAPAPAGRALRVEVGVRR